MSVCYTAGLIYGWKITKEEYENLDEEFRVDYAINTDEVCGQGQYFVGEILTREVDEGHSLLVNTTEITMTEEVYNTIKKTLPHLDTPKLYLYNRIW